jgi:hypothetical protein
MISNLPHPTRAGRGRVLRTVSALVLAISLPILTPGCGSPGASHAARAPGSGSGSGRGGGIAELVLIAAPVAVDLDGVPGADGFRIRIYASAAGRAKGVPISSGTLEIVMYDGIVSAAAGATATPLRTWQFTAEDLRGLAATSALGVGYPLALAWQKAVPAGSHISVIARYVPRRGPAIESAPSSIALGGR